MFSEKDKNKLFIAMAAKLAKDRKERNLKLNYTEATAYIVHETTEYVRDGHGLSDAMVFGATLLKVEDVMDGVAETLKQIFVEATFNDGTRSFTIHKPIR
ncbi:TPA: urease subunit gamma [Serratia odorifera]|nr:urease subunit gamma [Serratia odorifera]HEJ9098012.1 urease subunit gamma [Serratia odorifera]